MTTKLATKARLQDRGISVKDIPYSAVGDGVTDDGPAIQAAITAANVLGAAAGVMIWVHLPVGTYRLATYQGDSFTLLKSKSYVGICGPGTLKAGNGLRTTSTGIGILYNNSETLTNVVYRDFTVDFNGLNNLDLSTYGSTGHINRMGGGAVCSNVVVDNVTFKNAAGAHFLFLDGIGGSNVLIRNNLFQECGLSLAGNQTTDHSSIYCTSDRSEITGNTFYNSSVCEISTAIESHGSDVLVHGNRIRNYATTYNGCAQVQTNRDINFHDNVARNVRNGVLFWTSGSFGLSNVKVHDNILGLREPTGAYAAGRGVLSNSTTSASTVNISHLAIQNNEIFGETTALLTTLTAGIYLQRADDIVITGNKIHTLVAEAIYMESESAPRSMDRALIASNEIRDVGLTSTAANKRAMGFNALTPAGQKISTIDIRSNKIYLSAPAGTVASYGIQFNAGSFPDTRIVGNTIIGPAISPINKSATISADLFYVDGEGPGTPFNLIRASLGSRWVDTSSSPRRTYNANKSASDGASDVWQSVEYGTVAPASGAHQVGDICYNTAPSLTSNVGWTCTTLGTPGTWTPYGVIPALSGNKGDADATIQVFVDPMTVWFGSALTANRTVTLSTTGAYAGAKFRVFRTGLGSFTLDVGGKKTIPSATAAFVDVEYNGSTWQMTGYGTL